MRIRCAPTQFGGTGRPSCPINQVIAGRGEVPFTRPESVIQVDPLIQPQIVIPFTEAVFMNTGKWF